MLIESAATHSDDPRRARALRAQAPIAIVDIDEAFAIVGWNAAAESLFGYTAEETVKKPASDLLHGDGQNELLRQVFEAGGSKTLRLSCARKDGERIECEWSLASLKGDSGEPLGYAAFIRDVTSETLAAATYQKQHDMLQRLLDNMPIVLWSCDENGLFTMSEGAGLKGLGLTPGEVVGQSVFELYKNVPAIIAALRGALVGAPSNTQTEVRGRHWENRLIPVTREDGLVDGMLAISWDITERVEADQSLRQKLDLIEQQESAIRTLSTPIVRVWREVLALPLVGTIDEGRAERILSTLLEAVVQEQAQYVIIDMTGIGEVDTATADHLFRVLRALGLLGANAIVTGIKPAVAQTLVELGVDMSTVITFGYLEEALRFVMKSEKRQIAPAKRR